MKPEAESRKEFEAFILTTGRGERFIARFPDGSYIFFDVKLAWEAWQAARINLPLGQVTNEGG